MKRIVKNPILSQIRIFLFVSILFITCNGLKHTKSNNSVDHYFISHKGTHGLNQKILLNKKSQQYFKKEKMTLREFFIHLHDSSLYVLEPYWHMLFESIELNMNMKRCVFQEQNMLFEMEPSSYYYNARNCNPLDTNNYLMRIDLWRIIDHYGLEKQLKTYVKQLRNLWETNDSIKIVEFENLICMPMRDFKNGKKMVCNLEDAYNLLLPRSPKNKNIGCCDERGEILKELNQKYRWESGFWYKLEESRKNYRY
jgi:hypothetical protein